MISLIILYIGFILIYCLILYFGNSLEQVQYFHCKIMDNWEGIKDLSLCWDLKYSKQNALSLLYLCVLGSVLYSGVSFIKKPSFVEDIEIMYGYSFSMKKSKIGYILNNSDFLVIVLFSTSNLSDVLFSLMNTLIDIDDGQIHEGYYMHTIEFLPNILECLSKYEHKKKIYVTGHSLGGSLGSVLGYLLSKFFNYSVCVYTFGSPKFGNNQLKFKIESMKNIVIWNTINEADKIPEKPNNWKYTRIGKTVKRRVDTGNDNVNHGIKVYKEIVEESETKIKKRKHRFDEILSRVFLDILG